MATEELTDEEKKAAKEIDDKAAGEKTSLEKLGDQIGNVEDLIKSQVAEKEADEEGKKEDENVIDWEKVTPEELAKSLVDGENKDKAKEFITELVESCNILPQDMYSETGEPYIDENMLKSMEESEEAGQKLMSGILYSMQEANAMNAKKDTFQMQLLVDLAKSIVGIHGEMVEMKKSMSKEEMTVIPGNDDGNALPDLEGTAAKPLSQDEGAVDGSPLYNKGAYMFALKKSFPGLYGNQEDLEKQNKYADYFSRYSVNEAIAMIPAEDANLIKGHLPN